MWSALRSWMVDVCWHCGGTYSLLQAHLGGAVHARLVSKTHRASLVSSVDDDGDRVCLHDQCQTLEWWLTTAKDQSDQSLPAVWPASFDHRARQPLELDLHRKSCKPKAMPQALIAFHLLAAGYNFHDIGDTCGSAVNEELCTRVFLSGWGLFVGSIVGACVFHWLTQNVSFMRGWWERASTPIGILIYVSIAVALVCWFMTSRL